MAPWLRLRIEESTGNALKKANQTDDLAMSGGIGSVHDALAIFVNYNTTL